MNPRLTEDEHAVLVALARAGDPPTIPELASQCGLDQSKVSAFCERAAPLGWVSVSSRDREELVLEGGAGTLPPVPERELLALLHELGGTAPMQRVAQWAKERGVQVGELVKAGQGKGWLAKDGGGLALVGTLDPPREPDERTLELLAARGSVFADELVVAGIDGARAVAMLKNRAIGGKVVKLKERRERRAGLAPGGKALLKDPALVVVRPRNQLTCEDLASGAWRSVELRSYDVTLAAEIRRPAKSHPLMRILQETRHAFLRMGFEEIVGSHVETAFWDFDSLFQPQDHPARDMQDTFYLSRPARGGLPDDALVSRVKATHEDGGGTGSAGWGYRWSADEARRIVLRTHTTATTIQALAKDPHPPRKVFCVGRVFRNETISYKHLPEFTQVDGVIIDRHASFRLLLGTLAEFYRQMGFEKVKFKPAFFPYTEPSAEVFVWFAAKSSWIELGGCGVFRPEVTTPLGCEHPVLAWGLGLERLAMQRYGLSDIRQLYWSDVDVMRELPLCR